MVQRVEVLVLAVDAKLACEAGGGVMEEADVLPPDDLLLVALDDVEGGVGRPRIHEARKDDLLELWVSKTWL